MDTNALKKFAQGARNLLIDQVTAKLDLVVAEGSPARREYPQAVKDLENAINRDSHKQVVEATAYTWFNRFTALRFMDANGYSQVRVVSPADGQTRPEILSEAMAGNLPDGAPTTIPALLDGRTPSNDPQAEAYRALLVHTCNQWHGPMPFLFEQIDDYTELLMPEDLLSQTSILAELRKVMTEDACQDVEIIGWLYQFYISEKKDQVFAGLKKNQKITAENIPAATQLFTPHWIVRYLVENSLGRLWLLNRPQSRLAERMDYYIAPEEPETDFLRIARPEDIRICDPAAGSGHMLTYAFDLLYAIYEEEGYDATEIPALILTHNLTGVEIDDRAGALGAFALAMKAAAKLGRRRFLRMEAKPDICVLQNVAFTDAEMQDVAAVVGKDLFTDELRETLGQFEQAKNFGSLIVPKLRDPAEALRVVEARDFAGDLLLKDVQARVVAVLRMAEALSCKYHVVVANPPYAGTSGLNADLQTFAKSSYPSSKADLFAMFMERSASLGIDLSFWGMINLPSWMFISSFEKLRIKLLEVASISTLVHLGRGIFGSDFGTVAFVMSNKKPNSETAGSYRRLFVNHVQVRSSEKIEQLFLDNEFGKFRLPQKELSKIPGSPIAYWASENIRSLFEKGLLGDAAYTRLGMATADNNKFLRLWSEVSFGKSCRNAGCRDEARKSQARWFPYQKGGEFRKWDGNRDYFVDWETDGRRIQNFKDAKTGKVRSHNYNLDFIFKSGVTWCALTSGKTSARASSNSLFDNAGSSLFTKDDFAPEAVMAFINSCVMTEVFPLISPTLNYQPGDISKLPASFERSLQGRICGLAGQMVSIAGADWDAYETSWDFTTLPLLQPDHRTETLEGSYTALRTHWQGMTDEMLTLEEENNRIFIDAYGLQDELTPEVPLNEITLTCNPAYRYGIKNDAVANETRLRADTMAEFLSYAVGCMFGRYSLDTPGLILANQGETLADYLARIPEPSFMPDEDNVIPVLDADWFPDDITERFRLFLRVTFGEAHFRENLRYIEDALGKDIRKYFTKDFYADHVKRYKKRPIYWMFSSPKGTFNALIYMHRYQSDTVSVLLNDYLREFISKLEGERARLDKLSDDATATQAQRTKAIKDASVVAKQIDELNEWEREVIFPLAQQKIEIDLDNGVKANYPLFGSALKKIVGLS
ncbi:BREX-1 system adenine-specific DNA-methyltransferase PglX [Rhodobacteraceae bacterium KMM 6894]|nr:BREX-1 system adenine-specific DNA-methyltransferase PglX [Rhodobacteraceae bacterium KMM 6894]